MKVTVERKCFNHPPGTDDLHIFWRVITTYNEQALTFGMTYYLTNDELRAHPHEVLLHEPGCSGSASGLCNAFTKYRWNKYDGDPIDWLIGRTGTKYHKLISDLNQWAKDAFAENVSSDKLASYEVKL